MKTPAQALGGLRRGYTQSMSDIFISYSREDRARVRAIAESLMDLGWSVWWDPEIPLGQRYAEVIHRELLAARAVVVVWSEASINSHWVREEAEEGLERELLVPLKLDAVKPPLGLRSMQMTDLSQWQGDRGAAGFQALVDHLGQVLGVAPRFSRPTETGERSAAEILGDFFKYNRSEQFQLYRRGCDAHERRDYEMALALFEQAARRGDMDGQYRLGVMHFSGEGTPEDPQQAVKWVGRAADQGHSDAQVFLGSLYQDGIGVPQDLDKARRWYLTAIEQDNEQAEQALAQLDDSPAMRYRQAEAGDANAQFLLGLQFANGDGVVQDYAKARHWYGKAAAQGHAGAQNNIGILYFNGHGVAQNKSEAAKWYRRAAEAGNELAQGNLGELLVTGQGVEKDLIEGVKWLRKSAAQGNAQAQYRLGMQHLLIDDRQAAEWFAKAAAQGHQQAIEQQRKLGR